MFDGGAGCELGLCEWRLGAAGPSARGWRRTRHHRLRRRRLRLDWSCTTGAPAADWVCVNGGWVPPGHPLAGGGGHSTDPPRPNSAAGACTTAAPPMGVRERRRVPPAIHSPAAVDPDSTDPPTPPTPPPGPPTACTTALLLRTGCASMAGGFRRAIRWRAAVEGRRHRRRRRLRSPARQCSPRRTGRV